MKKSVISSALTIALAMGFAGSNSFAQSTAGRANVESSSSGRRAVRAERASERTVFGERADGKLQNDKLSERIIERLTTILGGRFDAESLRKGSATYELDLMNSFKGAEAQKEVAAWRELVSRLVRGAALGSSVGGVAGAELLVASFVAFSSTFPEAKGATTGRSDIQIFSPSRLLETVEDARWQEDGGVAQQALAEAYMISAEIGRANRSLDRTEAFESGLERMEQRRPGLRDKWKKNCQGRAGAAAA